MLTNKKLERRKRKHKKKMRGIVADMKNIVYVLVFAALGVAVLFMLIGATSYALSIFGNTVNSTAVQQGQHALATVSQQSLATIAILVAIPAILAAIIIVKYIASAFGFDLSFRLYRPTSWFKYVPRKVLPLVRV